MADGENSYPPGGERLSPTLGGAPVVIGGMIFPTGLRADPVNANRQLLEMILERVRRLKLSGRREDQAHIRSGSLRQ